MHKYTPPQAAELARKYAKFIECTEWTDYTVSQVTGISKPTLRGWRLDGRRPQKQGHMRAIDNLMTQDALVLSEAHNG